MADAAYLIKSLKVLNLDPILIEIALWIAETFGLYMITSAYRPTSEGVHGQMPVRGIDFRLRNLVVGTTIAAEINARYVYDKSRPTKLVAVYHETFDRSGQSNGLHLHVQSHPNTRRR